jgi:hypothetical protein
MISAAFPYQKQRRRVLGREMAYVEVGQATPSCCCTAIPPRPTSGGTSCRKGVHFVQEDSPDEIGWAVAGWMGTLADGAPCKAAMSGATR